MTSYKNIILSLILSVVLVCCCFASSNIPPLAQKVFKQKHCDFVLRNDYFTTCYSCKYKDPLVEYDQLVGKLVVIKAKRRNCLHLDKSLLMRCRSYPRDYKHSGFDLGHSGANNASFDWSKRNQYSTFVMSNIVTQYPNTKS